MAKEKIGNTEITLICVAIGVLIFAVAMTRFSDHPEILGMMNFMSAVVALGIPLTIRYIKIREVSIIESRFPDFLRDVTSNIETGMTLTQAIRTVSRNDYGPLSPHVKNMAAKLDWGINFDTVLEKFSDSVGSLAIKRSVKTIIETHRSGGYIGTVLEAVAESQNILERIKKERSASIYSQMVNGYVIFFVFLAVMYGLSEFLVPAFQYQGSATELAASYESIFRDLIVIQGIFAGISIGKMAEGSVFAGVKHGMVLVTIGYTVFTLL